MRKKLWMLLLVLLGALVPAGPATLFAEETFNENEITIEFDTLKAGCLHNFGSWTLTEEPTCGDEGEVIRTCTICGGEQVGSIPMVGEHDWGEWEIEEEPTCITGSKVRECIECGEVEEAEIPANGKHEWGKWVVTREATVFKTGKKTSECAICGKTKKKEVPKLKAFVKFKKTSYKVKAGSKITLTLKYAKGDKAKSWKSSERSVATVNKKGVVTGRKAGTARITVVMKSGKKATCKVQVKASGNSSSSTSTRSGNDSSYSGSDSSYSGSDSSGSSSDSGGTVYWTPSGKVYHLSRNCSTLKRSRTVYSGTVDESGKSRACKVCGY